MIHQMKQKSVGERWQKTGQYEVVERFPRIGRKQPLLAASALQWPKATALRRRCDPGPVNRLCVSDLCWLLTWLWPLSHGRNAQQQVLSGRALRLPKKPPLQDLTPALTPSPFWESVATLRTLFGCPDARDSRLHVGILCFCVLGFCSLMDCLWIRSRIFSLTLTREAAVLNCEIQCVRPCT
ncbi:hypothetical protein GWI33_008188 [Rhynchophorus ferrugineus]|uniref:Uncharacterized protein n=1 Tax=Rhynchophorus ferrugineus TaxID=354439 RepID=A0A834MEB1_RHYFE|nr:hypothetical protein GWI33_008188 [Rhynchophorus ferrugineus]